MAEITLQLNQLPEAGFNKPKPETYQLDAPLQAAVEVAINLGMPLLITGEPGTGKTQLAHKIAFDLNKHNRDFLPKPLVFHTKTTSAATDLFYQYDAIRHFYDAGVNKQTQQALPHVSEYIGLQALGKAIALTAPVGSPQRKYLKDANLTGFAGGSVVLIDEIDKAPRDFPNDILYEIERFAFQIKEDNNTELLKTDAHKIIVLMTSNSEKNLPDAFLRRCIFYHIPFPDETKLLNILQSHLGENSPYASAHLINLFMQVRQLLTKKKPATAELLNWVKMLETHNFLQKSAQDQQKIMRISYAILAKTFDDLQILLSKP